MPFGTVRSVARSVIPTAPPRYDRTVAPVDTADPPPVVFVHGFMDTWRTPWWDTLADHLVDAGWDRDRLYQVTTGALPGTTFGSPRDYAGDVQAVLESAFDAHGEPVNLVCHSMGGLNARWCVEHGDGAPYVRDIVTVATPHRGTYTAYLVFLTTGGRHMVPTSPFLDELNDGGLEPSVRYTAIASGTDRLIVPARNAYLPTHLADADTKNIAFDSHSHVQLLHDPDVVAAYVDRLA